MVYKEIKHLTMLKDVKQVVQILEVYEKGSDMFIVMEVRAVVAHLFLPIYGSCFAHLWALLCPSAYDVLPIWPARGVRERLRHVHRHGGACCRCTSVSPHLWVLLCPSVSVGLVLPICGRFFCPSGLLEVCKQAPMCSSAWSCVLPLLLPQLIDDPPLTRTPNDYRTPNTPIYGSQLTRTPNDPRTPNKPRTQTTSAPSPTAPPVQLCKGGELHASFESNEAGAFTYGDVGRIAVTMLVLADAMHSRGLVHCDLKPENFCLVEPLDSQLPLVNNLRLIDFGLSQRVRGGQAIAGVIVMDLLLRVAD